MYAIEDDADDDSKGNAPQTFRNMLNCKKDLYSLSQDFINTAKTYGRIIGLDLFHLFFFYIKLLELLFCFLSCIDSFVHVLCSYGAIQ
jgi:hypothetical protein